MILVFSESPVIGTLDFRFSTGLPGHTARDAFRFVARGPVLVAVLEQADLSALVAYQERLVEFLTDAQVRGWVRPEVAVPMLSGVMLDRVVNYVLYARWQQRSFGIDPLHDVAYRDEWVAANLDLFLNGLCVD